jgi:2-C-methyl-D-erythritol 4-phosphate cytidylyltransferase/2-C-methyl-D-erythritol 2,4-cyclodiphosphate synthase
VPKQSPQPTVGVVVVAAGSGTRLAQAAPKAFVVVAGATVLERSLRAVFALDEPAHIVVVAPEAWIADASAIAHKVAGAAADYIQTVVGGDTRQRSVTAGLAAMPATVETVLVHDSARALTPTTLFDAVINEVRSTGDGVIPGLPVADTIKRVDGPLVRETVDRSALSAVQTPQGFPFAALVAAYNSAGEDHTDDAALYAAAGHTVRVIQGDALAFKITTPWDLRRAESLLAESVLAESGKRDSAGADIRTGIGIDVHAYDAEAPLWLGGLFWPGEAGLAGHSDGDAIAHAICDALLSAAGLGDIGGTFGTDDPRFVDAHGEVFLTATLELVNAQSFAVLNIAVQVVGNRPRMMGRRGEIEQRLSALVGAPVSVSATTTDHLGFTGRGEGLTAIATALLRR